MDVIVSPRFVEALQGHPERAYRLWRADAWRPRDLPAPDEAPGRPWPDLRRADTRPRFRAGRSGGAPLLRYPQISLRGGSGALRRRSKRFRRAGAALGNGRLAP